MPELGPSGSVRGALSNGRPLYVAACSAETISRRTARKAVSLMRPFGRTNLCGRYGPASPSSAVHAERYPGTRQAADPAYKVVRRGALLCPSIYNGSKK